MKLSAIFTKGVADCQFYMQFIDPDINIFTLNIGIPRLTRYHIWPKNLTSFILLLLTALNGSSAVSADHDQMVRPLDGSSADHDQSAGAFCNT